MFKTKIKNPPGVINSNNLTNDENEDRMLNYRKQKGVRGGYGRGRKNERMQVPRREQRRRKGERIATRC